MNRLPKSYSCLIFLFAHICIFYLVIRFLPVRWMENDDVVMAFIAAGNFQGLCDGHLVFINVLLGKMIAGLYSLSHVVEWYTLFFCVIHILSATAITWYMFLFKHQRLTKVLWLCFFEFFWIRSILFMQFTTIAGFSAVAGCLLMLLGSIERLNEESKENANRLSVIGGGIFLHHHSLGLKLQGL